MDEQIPTPDEMWLAEEKAVQLGLLKRNSDGTVTITDKGEDYFLSAFFRSPPSINDPAN